MAGSPPGGHPPAGRRSPPAVDRRSPPEVLRFLARSDARRRVLLALAAEGPATRPALGATTGVPRSTLYRILGELDDRGLVEREKEGEGDRAEGRDGMGERYAATPTGTFLAERLRSLVDAVEVTGVLQALAGPGHLLTRGASGDVDAGSRAPSGVEVLVASAGDPLAPARRLTDRVAAACRARLLVPADGRVALEAALDARSADGGTFEAVVAVGLVESATADARTMRALREAVSDPTVALATTEGDLPAVAGVADGTAFAAIPDGPGPDGTGRIRGYVESDDPALRAGLERAYESVANEATALDAGAVAPSGVDGP